MKRHKKLAIMMTATLACSMLIAQPLLALAATTAPTVVVASPNTLQRLSGQDRYETAAKIAEQGWPTSSNYAILAAGMDDNLVDALTAAPLAKAMKAPILLTQGDSLNSFAQAELQRLGVNMVYVTSGTGVIQAAVTDQLSTMGITVIPLGGSDRYATAVNVAQTLASVAPISQLVVATAYSNADALSVAGIAAAQGMPILLTDVDTLPTATATYLNSLSGITHSYVVGGTGVVSEAVKNALPNAQRAGGVDRFDTNRQILQQFASQLDYGQVYVTNGEDAHLVDALAVAPLAALTQSPVVMSDDQVPAQTLAYVKANLLPKTIIALGGESVLPSASLSALNSSLRYTNAGDTEGSTNPNKRAVLSDRVEVSGDNVTLQNAVVPYSIYVTGNNATLTNLQVTGAIFLDPGVSGVTNLNNVNATNIVVLSGAANGLHLNNVTVNSLINPANITISYSGGGTVNGQSTTNTPTTPTTPPTTTPATPTTPVTPTTPSTPSSSGGSSGSSGSSGTTTPVTPVSTPTLAASSMTVQMNNATYNQSGSGSTAFNVDLSSVPDSARMMGIQISSNGVTPSITITSVSIDGVNNLLTSPKTAILTNGVMSISMLLGSLAPNTNGISLKSIRLGLGSGTMTLQGYLSETGYNDSPAVTVTINVGASTSGT